MKKAVLIKGSWSKPDKPKVVSVATPAKSASPLRIGPEGVREQQARKAEQKQGSAPVPRAVRIVQPQQGVGVPPVRPTIGSEPTNLKQTERIDEMNQAETNTVVKPITADGHYSNSPGAAIEEAPTEKTAKARESRKTEKLRSEPSRRRSRDLQSGMELLGLDFLLSIVEETASHEELDVTMRRLNFKELIRTDQLHAVDSNVLKVYALNSDGHYDKTIQCEAIKELTVRTAQGK